MSSLGVGQGIYSPLPQTITDSDSEEELHNSIIAKGHINTENINDKRMKTRDFHRYPSNEEFDDSNGFVLGMDNQTENISILQIDNSERMTPLRKFFFVFSIIICFMTVLIFLWLLPCSEIGKCTGPLINNYKKSSWENPYHDIEFKGTLNIVDGASGGNKNFILLFRGDIINPKHIEGVRSSIGNGIILIVGNSGKVGWFIRQLRLPTEVDCTLVDVDKDGNKDCIVVGEEGLFATFSALTGTLFWYLHNHNNNIFVSVEFPLVIMDINEDGVDDLLTSCTPYGSKNHNALILISGYGGNILSGPLTISECMSINRLQIDKEQVLSYTCKNYTTLSESLCVFKLQELLYRLTNKIYPSKLKNWFVKKQHQINRPLKETENQRNIYNVDGRKLIVENQSQCPRNCKVSVQLIDERTGNDNISWEYNAPHVYAMVPATLIFNNTFTKSHIAGFVLKFWQWNVNSKNSNRYDRNISVNTYNIFNMSSYDNERNSSFRAKKNLEKKSTNTYVNLTINHLIERVVLITFNATDIHIVNASQSDIIQICYYESQKLNCQPDMNYQENSLMITDIDGDGSQELVTYLTTFICTENALLDDYFSDIIKCNSEWKLRSTIRIVRLEAELPKLYEAVSHH